MDIQNIMGWIKPDGGMIGIQNPYDHPKAAAPFFPGSKDPEMAAEKAGWVRLSAASEYFTSIITARCSRALTQAQQDTLFEWCAAVGEDYQEYLIENDLKTEN